jgi:hypothetical protein
METRLGNIISKPSDYKVCCSCNKINWYENDKCIECQATNFDYTQVEDGYWEEIAFWREEGFNEYSADEMQVEV